MRLTIHIFQDKIYEVLDENNQPLFRGTYINCHAWIKLTEKDKNRLII